MEGLDGFGMGNGKVGGIKTYNCVLLGIFLLAKLCILYMYMYIFFDLLSFVMKFHEASILGRSEAGFTSSS